MIQKRCSNIVWSTFAYVTLRVLEFERVQHRKSRIGPKVSQNQKAKSIFFGGHSSNHSLLFSYSSHCFPFLCFLFFLFSVHVFFALFFTLFLFGNIHSALRSDVLANTLFFTASTYCIRFFYIFHLCIVIFSMCVCAFLYSLVQLSYAHNPFPFQLTICHYPRIWTYSVVIIQVPVYVSACPFGIRFNAIAVIEISFMYTRAKSTTYLCFDCSESIERCVCVLQTEWNKGLCSVWEREKKVSIPWHTHQFNPVKLNNFSKIFNMQYRCYMTASHLMKQYVSTSIGFIWAVEIWARKFRWQVRPFKGVLCEHNVR